jgi:hypothetical protein
MLMKKVSNKIKNHNRSSVGNCNLVKYDEELPKIYQNFDKVDGVARKDIGKVNSSLLSIVET